MTAERVMEPARVSQVFTPVTRTSVDSFYGDRWGFQHRLGPVTTLRRLPGGK